MPNAFFAYPSNPASLAESIRDACNQASTKTLKIHPWQQISNIGLKIDDQVEAEIEGCDFLAADITHYNFNVFYELGYAAAKSKPILPTVNDSIENADDRINNLGLFDTIGWLKYHNSSELAAGIRNWAQKSWVGRYEKPKDHTQPLFILDTLIKTDFRNYIFQSVQNYGVNFRSYDPTETPRWTASQAISMISSASGVIIPLLSSDVKDSTHHNMRAAFAAGLAVGYGIDPLMIQADNFPAPIDYRRYVKNSTSRKETERHVEQYCQETLLKNQLPQSNAKIFRDGVLSKINLGSSAAENETQTLFEYFVETAEYARATRAEAAVIIGRKGSGKSAIFFRLRDNLSNDRRNLVIDLRPASHNLSQLRESLLSVSSTGIFDHTIAAFWQYIIYFEILLALREKILPKSQNDIILQRKLIHVEETLGLNEAIVSGDFTSRLEIAIKSVVSEIERSGSKSDVRSSITNKMFVEVIPNLRSCVESLLDSVDNISILIDDLDKGWPARMVAENDVATIKHLIEVLRKIQNELIHHEVGFRHFLFLRSDIYEQLVQTTSDRGKYNVIKVDWSDSEQLRFLLKQRVLSSFSGEYGSDAWDAVDTMVDGDGNAVTQMIRASLSRPRFLIDLCERVISCAVNRGHVSVDSSDLEEGLRQMSLYLVSDFGYEMRDVTGISEDILYSFIGCSSLLTYDEIVTIVSKSVDSDKMNFAIETLLWYGVIGVIDRNQKPIFIYDVGYDARRLLNERPKEMSEQLYAMNPAFLRGLAAR